MHNRIWTSLSFHTTTNSQHRQRRIRAPLFYTNRKSNHNPHKYNHETNTSKKKAEHRWLKLYEQRQTRINNFAANRICKNTFINYRCWSLLNAFGPLNGLNIPRIESSECSLYYYYLCAYFATLCMPPPPITPNPTITIFAIQSIQV